MPSIHPAPAYTTRRCATADCQGCPTAAVVTGADVAVDIQVGNIADLRDRQTPTPALQRSAPDFQRSETPGEFFEFCVGQVLVAKHQHRPAIDRPQTSCTVVASTVLAPDRAVDFRADMR